MKTHPSLILGIFCVSFTAFAQVDEVSVFTNAISDAYMKRDVATIMRFYCVTDASENEIEKEHDRWEYMLNNSPSPDSRFQSVVFHSIESMRESTSAPQERLDKLQGLAREGTRKAIEATQKMLASLTVPVKRGDKNYIYNLPVSGYIGLQYLKDAQAIGGFGVPVSFDKDGHLRFPIQIPEKS